MDFWCEMRGVLAMRVLALVVVLCSLGGCAGSIVGDAMAGPEKLAQRDDAYCQSMGLKFGSRDYAQCRLVQDHQRAVHHARMGAIAATGLAIAAQPAPAAAPAPIVQSPAQVDIICRPIGGFGNNGLRCN